MTDPIRREFLIQTGSAIVAGELLDRLGATVNARDAFESTPSTSASVDSIPTHRPLDVQGVHVYSDKPSYVAGEPLIAYVSASVPCDVEVVRLGDELDGTSRDEVLHRVRIERPITQQVHPGSYIYIERGLPNVPQIALSLECWVRLWNLHEPQGILTQLDDASGFGLLVFPDGAIGFFTGECSDPIETPHRSVTKLDVPGKPTVSKYITPSAQWHHIMATVNDERKAIWIDGRLASEWEHRQPLIPAACPLRIGALGRAGFANGLLDADIAMPAIYSRALTEDEIRKRYAERGLKPPLINSDLLGCWPLVEERGTKITDVSNASRDGAIINAATWMIGGPSFLPASALTQRDYNPELDVTRGHGLRLASDDLYDCRWQPTFSYDLTKTARPGLYALRARFSEEDSDRMTNAVFVVRRAAEAPRASIALLFATNTWKAYSGAPFCSAWPGVFAQIGNQGYQPKPNDPVAAFCFYRFHRAGQPTYKLGWRMPWPAASPYALSSTTEIGYGHLSRADRFTQQWLENNGYQHDTLSDLDLHRDERALDGTKVLFIVGHSEYWSRESMQRVREFLDNGGKIVCLSGNSMYWRVTHDLNAMTIECRKAKGGGAQIADNMYGECWHEHDRRRGGVPRDCEDPAWRTIGVESVAATPMNAKSAGNSFRVVDALHPFFHTPNETGLAGGDSFGFDTARATRQPVGHESDVRVSILMGLTKRSLSDDEHQVDFEDPPGIRLLAQGRFEADGSVGTVLDYLHRSVKPAMRQSDDSICDVIHWQRVAGGEVFAAPSIAAGWTLAVCPKWSAMLKNVLHHFGIQREPENRNQVDPITR